LRIGEDVKHLYTGEVRKFQKRSGDDLIQRLKIFAANVIRFTNYFPNTKGSRVISNQLIRAASSIGANFVEAQESSSHKEFVYKVSVCLKEAKESLYWLELVTLSGIMPQQRADSLLQENTEIVKILIVSLKKLRAKQ
jgi:four helix bundle protein